MLAETRPDFVIALDHWRRGMPPPIGVADCARVALLIDQAYDLASRAAG